MATAPQNDDPTIGDEVKLLRRIPPGRFSPIDGRPDSSGFKKDPGGLGTSVTPWFTENDLAAVVAGHESFGIVCVRADVVRALGFTIQKTFVAGNPNHCEMAGDVSNGKREKLSKAARWVRFPAGYPAQFEKPLCTIDEQLGAAA